MLRSIFITARELMQEKLEKPSSVRKRQRS
jgi:hypothetical protein